MQIPINEDVSCCSSWLTSAVTRSAQLHRGAVLGALRREGTLKLFAGTGQRFSCFSQAGQCDEDMLRMLVTGAPPDFGGGGIPHTMVHIPWDASHQANIDLAGIQPTSFIANQDYHLV
jgi:hypothetical protein